MDITKGRTACTGGFEPTESAVLAEEMAPDRVLEEGTATRCASSDGGLLGPLPRMQRGGCLPLKRQIYAATNCVIFFIAFFVAC